MKLVCFGFVFVERHLMYSCLYPQYCAGKSSPDFLNEYFDFITNMLLVYWEKWLMQ